jgi:hypothetical protein
MASGNRNKAAPCFAAAWRRAQPGQIVGPRHARPRAGLRVPPVPPLCGEFDRTCARPPRKCQVGTKEQSPRSNQGTSVRTHQRLQTAVSPQYSDTPNKGETISASHTEILTVPPNVLVAVTCAVHIRALPITSTRRALRQTIGLGRISSQPTRPKFRRSRRPDHQLVRLIQGPEVRGEQGQSRIRPRRKPVE